MPGDKVDSIMEEIRGPAGRTMWDKLANVNETVLANYLKNEYPADRRGGAVQDQAGTCRARAGRPARGIRAGSACSACCAWKAVQRDILDKVEQTLRVEFMSNLARTSKRDSHEQMADIFNNFDRQTESRFITALEERNRDSAERIRALMFAFEDLGKLDPGASRPCCAASRRTSWAWR